MEEIPGFPPVLMDGATGTELLRRGMPRGVCTERWILEHPQTLLELQRTYVRAGSHILLAPTFGANRASLARAGDSSDVEDVNARLVALTRKAAGPSVRVAAGLAPTGLSIPPFGQTPFEELVQIYAQQAAACKDADLFVLETAVSMAEARAAVLAVRSVSDKPVWACFTCGEDGRTPTGVDVLAAMIVMQGMGVSAFGLNCSDGPDCVAEQLERLAPYAAVPLIAKPSAGLPTVENGMPVYDCTPERFASFVPRLAAAGVGVFGGCCGAGPKHIEALKRALAGVTPAPIRPQDPDVIPCASEKEARFITPEVDVGESIECTPDLLEDILNAEEDSPQGALKISVLEQDDVDIFAENQYAIKDALCLTTDVPELLEAALRAYQGRAFWDGTEDEIDPAFLREMSRKYGLILL